MSKFYAVRNELGFYNTWDVYAFSSRAERDQWIENSSDSSITAITKSEISSYLSRRVEPFSGEFYGIDEFFPEMFPDGDWRQQPGLIGKVQVMDADTPVERVF